MKQFYRLLYPLLLLLIAPRVNAQVISCPDNIDFEFSSFANWYCDTGINIGQPTNPWFNATGPQPARHVITSGNGTDPVCGIPVVAPDGGRYSVKLGDTLLNRRMNRIRRYFTIPPGQNRYSIFYRYAVVMQDPGHDPKDQPFFKVVAYDSLTGQQIACDSIQYVSSGSLPGFNETSPGSHIWYKNWSVASLKLTGLGGRTIRLEFTSADCAQGDHYGYAYVDMSCGLFKLTSVNCNAAPVTPLSAPPGFRTYTWYDNAYSTVLGNTQSIIIPTPSGTQTYHVVLQPYAGMGCQDTLTGQLIYSSLTVNATPDTADLCATPSVTLNASASGPSGPFVYAWSPSGTLSCNTCSSPIATPSGNTLYRVTVSDTAGCTASDSVYVRAPVTLSETHTNISCYGRSDGMITITPTGGLAPYTYSWPSVPGQNVPTIQNLPAGSYSVTVLDARNCVSTKTVVITQPPRLSVQSAATNVRCLGVGLGKAWVVADSGTRPYTYVWNTVPVQYGDTARNLPAGFYSCTVTDANGCTRTITQEIEQTSPLVVTAIVQRRSCPDEANSEVIALASNANGPVTYSWNTTPVRITQQLTGIGHGTYIVTAKDSMGCIGRDTVTVIDYDYPQVHAGNNEEICAGDTTTLTASGSTTYLWQAAAPMACYTCASSATWPATTTYYKVIGTDGNGCRDTDRVTVTVIERAEIGVDSAKSICKGDKVMLGARGGISYEWSPAGSLDGPVIPNPTASPASTTNYRVIITENRCFTDTLYQQITVLPLPTIDIMNGFNGIPGAVVPLTTTTTRAQSITWAPPTGLSCTNCYQPIATLNKTIVYTAEVTDSAGCKARDTIRIVVGCNDDAFFMANTFTPNNDGRNDYFYPQGLGVNTVHRFAVYDRWGEVVFEAKDIPVNVPERGWNGTYKGKELPSDVFVYVVEAVCPDGNPVVIKGDVALVK